MEPQPPLLKAISRTPAVGLRLSAGQSFVENLRVEMALQFTQRSAANVSVKSVSIAYADKFGLPPATCKLYYEGSELTDQTLEQVVTEPPVGRNGC